MERPWCSQPTTYNQPLYPTLDYNSPSVDKTSTTSIIYARLLAGRSCPPTTVPFVSLFLRSADINTQANVCVTLADETVESRRLLIVSEPRFTKVLLVESKTQTRMLLPTLDSLRQQDYITSWQKQTPFPVDHLYSHNQQHELYIYMYLVVTHAPYP